MLKVHQDIIVSKLDLLVDETNLDTLIPELLNKNVFNERMINRILNPSHNVKHQKTDLYVELLKRGPQAFEKLQDALISSNHLNLAEILRDMDAQRTPPPMHRSSSLNSVGSNLNSSDNDYESDGPVMSTRRKTGQRGITRPDSFPGRFPKYSVSQGHSKESSTEAPDLSNIRDPKNKVFVPPTYGLHSFNRSLILSGHLSPGEKIVYDIEQNIPVRVKYAINWQTETREKPQIYKMDSNPRGHALIVNNRKFDDDKEYPEREGSENDVTRLRQLIEQLHFEVEFHQNKTKREMEEIVATFSQKPGLEKGDCIWVTFMSHGQEGDSYEDSEIIGVDGMGYKTDDIVSRFYNDNCKAAINKPKLFFFQACRGCLSDPGVAVGSFVPFFRDRITTDGRRVRDPRLNTKIRTHSDIFIVYPTPGGIQANRDRITGAWFIQAVVDVFSELAWNAHLEDMLKKVDEKIKNVNNLYDENFQAVTTKTIGWNKNLYFNPGLYRDPTTRETLRFTNPHESPLSDEGMDVVDSSSSNSGKSPVGTTTYSRLKDNQDQDSDGRHNGSDFFGCFGCRTS